MPADIDLNQLTESERDQILQVLRRDEELRKKEEERIRKLRNEVKQLRLKGVIKDGHNADKTCARCRQPFGWLFNTGALCPVCQHRVCEKCREKKDKNTWICVLCFKQMELEAMTNHWFYSKFRKSKRSRKTNRVISGSEIVRASFRKPSHANEDGTALAGNSLTEEVKRALYSNHPGTPAKSPVDGENSDTQSTEGIPPTKRLDRVAFPEEEDKQLLMELIKPRRQNNADGAHRFQVKRVTSNRYRDSDSDSDSVPSSPQLSSHNESMFTHTDSQRSSLRSSVVSSDGRITVVTDVGGLSDMEVASVDTHMSVPIWDQEEGQHGADSHSSYKFNNSHSPAARARGAAARDQHGGGQRGSRPHDHGSTSGGEDVRGDGTHRDGHYRCSSSEDSFQLESSARTDNAYSPQSRHREHWQNDDLYRDGPNRLKPYRGSPHGGSPQRGSPHPSQSGQRHGLRHSPTSGNNASALQREFSASSTDSESLYNKELRKQRRNNHPDKSRTPSPDDRYQTWEKNRALTTSGASVGNGHLAPPGKRRTHRSGASDSPDRQRPAAVEPAASSGSSKYSEKPGDAAGDVKSASGSLPSSGRNASPLSDHSSASIREVEDEENIDELFESHASMQSFTDSKKSTSLLSPITASRESIASYYSDAGEGNYGKIPITGEILFGLDYNYKNNTFEIHIKQCRDLAAVDTKRKRSDPYVKTYLLPDKTKSGKRKTRVKKHTLSPTFDETLRYQITKSELENRTLWLTVWHNDTFGRNDFLGEVNIPMDEYTFTKTIPRWYQLQERHASPMSKLVYKGDLVVSMKFVTSGSVISKRRGGGGERGELQVLIKEARNLTALRANGTSDPFCKGYLLPERTKHTKQKTPVKKKDCNPKWNHTFIFEDIAWADLKERCLELTVWDHDRFTSNDFLGGVRLSLGTGTSGGHPVEWMDSTGEEVTIWRSMLERPNVWINGTLLLRSSMDSRK